MAHFQLENAGGDMLARAISILVGLYLFVGQAVAEERLALLIGNSLYEAATPLRNPENDIEVVRKSLEAVGFKTTQMTNVGLDALRQGIDSFVDKIGAASRPVVLVYIAGHGIQRNGKNFFLPVDAKVSDAESLASTALSIDHLVSEISAADAELRIIVLDACRNDPFESLDRSAVPIQQGLAEVPQATGQLIAYSTGPGKTATDGDTGTSPYATAFAEAVLVPGLTVRTVFDRVREKVRERTKGIQEPWETSAVYQDFRFVPQTENVEISEIEALLWDNAALLDSAETYQRYIDRFPSGRFAALAKQKIENINKDFAFRKQADTFPVLQDHDGMINFCKSSEFDTVSIAFDNFFFLHRFEDELVYVDFVIPLKHLTCMKDEIYELDLEAVTPDADDCYQIIGFSTDEPRYWENCIRKPTYSPKDSWEKHLIEFGGLVVRQNNQALFLSAMDTPYYRYRAWDGEGNFEEASVVVQGLVRVHTYMEEIFGSYFLEPIDPAELGLTWKFQNTISALGTDVAKSGVQLKTLASLRAETDASMRADFEEKFAEPVSEWEAFEGIATLERKGNHVSIVYKERTIGAGPQNLKPGAILFEGEASGTSSFRGKAYAHRKGCKAVAYDATLEALPDDWEVVIEGKYPELNRQCVTVTQKAESTKLQYHYPDEPENEEAAEGD